MTLGYIDIYFHEKLIKYAIILCRNSEYYIIKLSYTEPPYQLIIKWTDSILI